MTTIKKRFDQATADKDIEALQSVFREIPDIPTLFDRTGCTPTELLLWVTLADHVAGIQACLERGATITPEVEQNALFGAGLEAYQLLVPAGLDVNRDFGWSATALLQAIADDQQSLVEYLLKNGANPNIGSMNGSGALEVAISEQRPVSLVKLLIEHGAEFPISGLVLLATIADHPDMIEFLVQNGVDVNETTDQSFVTSYRGKKFTALHLAAYEGILSMVEMLLKHGADRSAKDVDGKSPLELAQENGHTDVVALLK